MVSETTIHAPGPVRTCVGCRQRTQKSELVRVVAGAGTDGRPAVLPDPSAAAPGRGAHLHPSAACHELAVRRRAYPRALRVQGALDPGPVGEYLAAQTEGVAVLTDGDPPQIDRPETGAGSS